MAWTIIPKPCADACKHQDCAWSRETARVVCVYCMAPIGYEKPATYEYARDCERWVHFWCAVEDNEAES